MDILVVLILLIFGAIFGMISSIAGIGGGAFYMSLMILLFAINPDEARDTSTFIIFFFSGTAFYSYFKQGKVNLKIALIFASFALFGSITSTIFFILLPIENFVLKIIIASVVLVSGINMIRKAIISYNLDRNNGRIPDLEFSFENFDFKSNLKKGIPLFFIAGFVAHLSGIGGGMLFIPVLSILFKIPIHYTTALSSTMIFFIGIYNTASRMVIGEIQYLVGILIAIGAIVGSLLGTRVSSKIPKNYLQFGVAVILIILAVRMYLV
ncbi:MAG: sulfite exporter TauE/SafE family protein [Promethearchaeota archaeon]|jgi:uncharacterized membrane protein YfcA